MPLSSIQRDALAVLAAHRSPESFVAGATPITRSAPRTSDDIDVFQDVPDSVGPVSAADAAALEAAGFRICWLRRLPAIVSILVSRGGEETRLEWVTDSDFRFFPAVPDKEFGYRLHLADIATNKALAAAGRREPRDILDLLLLHKRFLPLGAIVWAAVGKDPGMTPEYILGEISRASHYRPDDFERVNWPGPIDIVKVSTEIRSALAEANPFVREMPAGQEGLLYLADGRVVQPDPERLSDYATHAGTRRGHWPSNAEIEGEMIASQTDVSGFEL